MGKIYFVKVGENEKLSDVTKISWRCANQVDNIYFTLSNKTWSPPKLNFEGLHVLSFLKI